VSSGNGSEATAILTKEEMAAFASRIERELVPVALWEGKLIPVRALTAGERGRYRRAQAQVLSGEVIAAGGRRGRGESAPAERRMRLDFSALPDLPVLVCSMGICLPSSIEPMFTHEELEHWPPAVVDVCHQAILRLSGIQEGAEESEAGKDASPESPSASSCIGSPSPSDAPGSTSSPQS